MKDGCYNEDGKCVNCGQFHLCACEAVNDDIEEQIAYQESQLNDLLEARDEGWY